MAVTKINRSLPGYEGHDTIQITYHIPPGVQVSLPGYEGYSTIQITYHIPPGVQVSLPGYEGYSTIQITYHIPPGVQVSLPGYEGYSTIQITYHIPPGVQVSLPGYEGYSTIQITYHIPPGVQVSLPGYEGYSTIQITYHIPPGVQLSLPGNKGHFLKEVWSRRHNYSKWWKKMLLNFVVVEERWPSKLGTIKDKDVDLYLFQGPEHPNPGQPYSTRGFPRTGYLPDNKQGRKVSTTLHPPIPTLTLMPISSAPRNFLETDTKPKINKEAR